MYTAFTMYFNEGLVRHEQNISKGPSHRLVATDETERVVRGPAGVGEVEDREAVVGGVGVAMEPHSAIDQKVIKENGGTRLGKATPDALETVCAAL